MRKKWSRQMAAVCATALIVTTGITGCGAKNDEDEKEVATEAAKENDDNKEKEDDVTKKPESEDNKTDDDKDTNQEGNDENLDSDENTNDAEQTDGVMALEDCLYVKELESTCHSKKLSETSSFDIEISNIEVVGEKNAEAVSKINDELKRISDEALTNANAMFDTMVSSDMIYEDVFAGMSLNYHVKRCDNDVISLLCEIYSSAGGAHPEVIYITHNFDAKTGEELTLASIADDENKLRETAGNYIITELSDPYYKDMLLNDLDVTEAVMQDVVKDENWYFTKTGIVFISNVYTLAPHAAGTWDFEVPFDELDGLKKEYSTDYSEKIIKRVGGKTEYDLNKDGTADSIKSSYTFDEDGKLDLTLEINGKDFSEIVEKNIWDGYTFVDKYVITDIDESDDFVEVILMDYGASDDPVSFVYRYDGEEFKEIGYIYDLFIEAGCYADGKGLIKSFELSELGTTLYTGATYKLDDKGCEKQKKWDYFFERTGKLDFDIKVKKDVTVYSSDKEDSQTIKLTSSETGNLAMYATDNTQWLVLADEKSEKLYYLKMKNFLTIDDGQDIQEVFENIVIAG